MSVALGARYEGYVCDLDGVVYAGPQAIPHAVPALERARQRGTTVVFATNNASRPPEQVAAHLRELGLTLRDDAVVNSSMAGARSLVSTSGSGAGVLAVGGQGVAAALTNVGLVPVTVEQRRRDDTPVAAVLQGYGPDVRASDLAEVAHAVQAGARWVATNTDLTLPTDRGTVPGNGSLVAAVRNAVDVDPEIVGKPMPVMYEMAAELMGLPRGSVLAIGDRLETDVEGAVRGGFDSVLVLTGVHALADAAAADDVRRPTYVVEDLRGLVEPYDVEEADESDLTSRAALPMPRLRGLLQLVWQRRDAGSLTREDARRVFSEREARR